MNKNKINVLQVVNSLAIGGLEKVAINIINNQPDPDRVKFSIICLEQKGALANFLKPEIRVYELNKNARPYCLLIRDFVQIVKKDKIDIIHCHNYAPLLFSVLVKLLLFCKVKIVYTEHNQIYSISKKHYKRFKQLLKFADSIITVSENLQTYFKQEKLGKKSTVIWNGISAPSYEQKHVNKINAEYRRNPDDFLVGTAVVMSKQKGLKYLIEASVKVIENYPQVKFLLVGDGPLKNKLEAQVEALGLEKNFYFPGYRKDVPDYIKAMDIFIMPSLWEGFSIALLEANALGIPIITTNVGGNSEIVKHNLNGLLIESKNPDAIFKAIATLYLDKELRLKFAENGQKLFKMHFDVSMMVENYDNIYFKI